MSRSEPDFELVELTLEHAEFILELLQSPPYKEFIGDRGVRTVDQAADYLDNYFLESQREHGFGYQVVLDAKAVPIGMVGLMKRDYLEYPDIGFAFLPQSFGKGYALASSRRYLAAISKAKTITKIQAFTDANNLASQKLLQRLNFELESEFEHPDDGLQMLVYGYTLN